MTLEKKKHIDKIYKQNMECYDYSILWNYIVLFINDLNECTMKNEEIWSPKGMYNRLINQSLVWGEDIHLKQDLNTLDEEDNIRVIRNEKSLLYLEYAFYSSKKKRFIKLF